LVDRAEDVRQEVAGGVHDVDRRLALPDADVDVQAEDQVGPRTCCMSSTIAA